MYIYEFRLDLNIFRSSLVGRNIVGVAWKYFEVVVVVVVILHGDGGFIFIVMKVD